MNGCAKNALMASVKSASVMELSVFEDLGKPRQNGPKPAEDRKSRSLSDSIVGGTSNTTISYSILVDRQPLGGCIKSAKPRHSAHPRPPHAQLKSQF